MEYFCVYGPSCEGHIYCGALKRLHKSNPPKQAPEMPKMILRGCLTNLKFIEGLLILELSSQILVRNYVYLTDWTATCFTSGVLIYSHCGAFILLGVVLSFMILPIASTFIGCVGISGD